MHEVNVVGNHIHVKLSGNIDAAEAAKIAKRLSNYVDNSQQMCTVDFSDVDSIDRAGFGVFLNVKNIVSMNGCCVGLSGLNGLDIQESQIVQEAVNV